MTDDKDNRQDEQQWDADKQQAAEKDKVKGTKQDAFSSGTGGDKDAGEERREDNRENDTIGNP